MGSPTINTSLEHAISQLCEAHLHSHAALIACKIQKINKQLYTIENMLSFLEKFLEKRCQVLLDQGVKEARNPGLGASFWKERERMCENALVILRRDKQPL